MTTCFLNCETKENVANGSKIIFLPSATLIPSEIAVYSVVIIINYTLLLSSSARQLDMKYADKKKIKINLWKEEIGHLSGFSENCSPPENLSMAPCRYSHTLILNSLRKGHVILCIAQSIGCSLAWFWPMPVAISPSNAQVWRQHRPGTFLNRLHGWSYPFLRSSCAMPHTLRPIRTGSSPFYLLE